MRWETGATRFSVSIHDRSSGEVEQIENLSLAMPGEYNVQNATAAIAIAHQLGIGADAIRAGAVVIYGASSAVFTRTGEWNGAQIF